MFFLIKLAMLIQVLIKNEQDQADIFQYTYFYNFQIYLQAMMYHFEYIDLANHPGYLF